MAVNQSKLIKRSDFILLLRILIILTIILFLIGILAPIFTLTKLLFIQNSFSILSGSIQLIENKQWFLFILIFGFSIVLPLAKIIILSQLVSYQVLQQSKKKTYLIWMHRFGKWSMLDVFVVAILIVSVKLGPLVDIRMEYGLYAFTIAIFLVMIITSLIVKLNQNQ